MIRAVGTQAGGIRRGIILCPGGGEGTLESVGPQGRDGLCSIPAAPMPPEARVFPRCMPVRLTVWDRCMSCMAASALHSRIGGADAGMIGVVHPMRRDGKGLRSRGSMQVPRLMQDPCPGNIASLIN